MGLQITYYQSITVAPSKKDLSHNYSVTYQASKASADHLHRFSQSAHKHTNSAFKLPNSTSQPGFKYRCTSQSVFKYHKPLYKRQPHSYRYKTIISNGYKLQYAVTISNYKQSYDEQYERVFTSIKLASFPTSLIISNNITLTTEILTSLVHSQ